MRAGSLTFSVNLDDSKAAKKLDELNRKIENTKREIEAKTAERNGIAESLKTAKNEAEAARIEVERLETALRESKAKTEFAPGQAVSPQQYKEYLEESKRQKENSAELEKQKAAYREKSASASKLSKELDRENKALERQTQRLDDMQRKAGGLIEEITYSKSVMGRMKNATEEANKKMDKFVTRVKNLAKRVFVFSLITSALRSMRTWFGNVIKSNKEATAAIAKFKGALLTLVQPLVNIIIPAFTTLVNVLTRIVNTVAALVAKIFGTTAEESAKAAEALYKQTEALDSTGNAAKNAAKRLANFDEINQLGETSGSSTIAPDFSGVVSSGLDAISQGLTATAILAIGAILALTGASIPVGLAMMVAGGLILYGAAKDDKDGFSKLMAGRLGNVFKAVSPFLAVIGIALMVFGHFFIGLAMILLGIELFALGNAGDENNGDFSQRVLGSLRQALRDIGPWIAIVGIALTCLGHFVTGIAMILAGTAIFKVGDETLDWNALGATLKEVLANTLEDVGLLVAVIGVLLCCIGQFAKGLALILFGFAAFQVGKAINTDWDALGASLSDALALTLVKISAFCIVIGILLCFVPGMLAHGIGLIIAGLAAISYTATTPSWDFILQRLKQAWEDIKNWFKTDVKYYLSQEYWTLVGQEMLNGLLHPFGNWDKVLEYNPNFTGIGPDYSWMFEDKEAKVTLPSLANGSTVPSNRNFNASWVSPTAHELEDAGILSPASSGLSTVKSSRSTTVVLELDRRELGRAVVETGGRESTRIGTKLVY